MRLGAGACIQRPCSQQPAVSQPAGADATAHLRHPNNACARPLAGHHRRARQPLQALQGGHRQPGLVVSQAMCAYVGPRERQGIP